MFPQVALSVGLTEFIDQEGNEMQQDSAVAGELWSNYIHIAFLHEMNSQVVKQNNADGTQRPGVPWRIR